MTVQALIGRYPTVCGMTGTALAAGEQFRQFYELAVSQIPQNTDNIRIDEADRVYNTKANKAEAVVAFVKEIHETGQPMLIGTHDVAESEELEYLLDRAGVKAVVLNAKNDAEEASIIAEAGALDAVTVSTQMAGRGTDIKLGGSRGEKDGKSTGARDQIVELGGLCVVGTGRHDTERLDNQLRGRAGRQGDPGRSVFFSSLEDPVVTRNLSFKRAPESESEDGSMGAKGIELIEQAQRVAEGIMLELHANTWRYNKLVNQQRRHRGQTPQHPAEHVGRPQGAQGALAGPLRGADREVQRGAAGDDLPPDHALPPGGDAWVNWIGGSAVPISNFESFGGLFHCYYQWAKHRPHPMMAWTGVVERPGNPVWKANYLRNARRTIHLHMTKLKAFMYFNSVNGRTDYWADTTPRSFNAYVAMACAPYFETGGPRANC